MNLFKTNEVNGTLLSNIVPILKIGNIRETMLIECKVVPHIVLDTRRFPELEALIKSHENILSGYVKTTWGFDKRNKNHVFLVFEFNNPFEYTFCILLEINKYALIIENIIRYGVVTIRSRNMSEFNNLVMMPGITLEVPSQQVRIQWETIWLGYTEKQYRKLGYSKKQAKEMARSKIQDEISKYFYWEEFRTVT